MITQTAKDICFSGVYNIVINIAVFAMFFAMYIQVLSSIWSVIDHFVRGNKIRNELIIPEKWFGMYFMGYLLYCLAQRHSAWNIFAALPVYIGIISLFWTAYERWGKKDGKNTTKGA